MGWKWLWCGREAGSTRGSSSIEKKLSQDFPDSTSLVSFSKMFASPRFADVTFCCCLSFSEKTFAWEDILLFPGHCIWNFSWLVQPGSLGEFLLDVLSIQFDDVMSSVYMSTYHLIFFFALACYILNKLTHWKPKAWLAEIIVHTTQNTMLSLVSYKITGHRIW